MKTHFVNLNNLKRDFGFSFFVDYNLLALNINYCYHGFKGCVKDMIDKSLINTKYWLQIEENTRLQNDTLYSNLEDFIATCIIGLHFSFSLDELTLNSSVFMGTVFPKDLTLDEINADPVLLSLVFIANDNFESLTKLYTLTYYTDDFFVKLTDFLSSSLVSTTPSYLILDMIYQLSTGF